MTPPDLSADARPTSAVVPVGSIAGVGDYFVYWSHGQACFAVSDHGRVVASGCDPAERMTDGRSLWPDLWSGGISLAHVRAAVRSAAVRTPDGSYLGALLVTGKGFPARLAVVLHRNATADGRWLAFGGSGRLLPTAQPFILRIRAVARARTGHSSPEIRVERTVAAVVTDGQSGWGVTVTLQPAQAQELAALSEHVLRGPRPRGLAFVLDGRVLATAVVRARITHGTFVIGLGDDAGRARELAAELSGG